MKLVMTLLLRNEEDILASTIDYHLNQGVDYIIATDNLSDDGTPDILESYRQMGVLQVIQESEDNYAQHKWVTRMARLACTEYQADWVINNDADEFWWPEQGDNIKGILAAQDESVLAVTAPRTNFVPLGAGNPAQVLGRMIYRESDSRNALGEPLQSKVCHRAHPDIEVAQGNHSVKCNGVPWQAAQAPLLIFHFPLRHYGQFSRKIALGGAAYARNDYLKPGMGSAWRRLYEKWQVGELEAYYQEQTWTDEQIVAGLDSGKLIRDERLKGYLAGLK